jgi:flavin reductase (DIM6/NTAB) family NADH-FMN oxidoreductase RutF
MPVDWSSGKQMTMAGPELDGAALRAAFGTFPTGVVAVGGRVDGVPMGLAASTFVPVSLDPPLVSFCVQHTSTTWPRLRGLPRLGVSVLGEAHGDSARALAARTGDRFAGLSIDVSSGSAVLLDGCPATLECAVEQEIPAGDHAIVLLRVLALRTEGSVAPLVFHGSRFRALLPMAG